jgi:hypothetical protein
MPRVRLAMNASDIDDCGRLPHQAARHQASQAPFRLRQLRSAFTWRVPRMDPADVLASRREPGFGVGAGREFRNRRAAGARQPISPSNAAPARSCVLPNCCMRWPRNERLSEYDRPPGHAAGTDRFVARRPRPLRPPKRGMDPHRRTARPSAAISRTRIEQRRRLPGTHGRRAPPPGRRAWGAGQNACAPQIHSSGPCPKDGRAPTVSFIRGMGICQP